jgi:hypothetical protein
MITLTIPSLFAILYLYSAGNICQHNKSIETDQQIRLIEEFYYNLLSTTI